MSNKKSKNNKKKNNSYKKQPEDILNKEVIDDSWIYIVLLSSIVVLLESLKNFTFKISDYTLTYSLFILPIIYIVISYIYKKFGMKKAFISVLVSDIVMFIFVFLIYFALGKEFTLYNIMGEFIGYIISLLIFIFINNNIIKKRKNILLLLGTYIFSIIIFYMFYTIFYIKSMNFDLYWISYFITLGIQLLICIPIVLIDRKIINKKYVK